MKSSPPGAGGSLRSNVDIPQLLSGPFWGELRCFLAVAKTRSFSQAAQILNSSQPTVGRAIKRLEDIIGAQLVVSSAKGIVLTERGAMLATAVRKIDFELYQVATILQSEKKDLEGVVRVSMSEGLCGFFVAPQLGKFSASHPRIRIDLMANQPLESVRANNCDILVSLNPAEAVDMASRRAGTAHLIPLVSETYIKKSGIPRRDNLADHFFVDSPVYQSASPIWKSWQEATRQGHVIHTCENSFPYGLMVRSGLGIGLLGNYAMAEKSLVPIDIDIAAQLPIYIVAMKDRLNSRPAMLVFDWLAEVLGPSVPWLSDLDNPRLAPTTILEETLDQLLPSIDGNGS